jgi:hypothetical protein
MLSALQLVLVRRLPGLLRLLEPRLPPSRELLSRHGL